MKRTTIGILILVLALCATALTGCGSYRGQPDLTPDLTPMPEPDWNDGYVDDDADGRIDDHGRVDDGGIIGEPGTDMDGTHRDGNGGEPAAPGTSPAPSGTPAPTATDRP